MGAADQAPTPQIARAAGQFAPLAGMAIVTAAGAGAGWVAVAGGILRTVVTEISDVASASANLPGEAASFHRQAQQLEDRVGAIASGMATVTEQQNTWAEQNLEDLQANLQAGQEAIARHTDRHAIAAVAMARGDRRALADAERGVMRWLTMLTTEAVIDLQDLEIVGHAILTELKIFVESAILAAGSFGSNK
jgi:hypothetical protein